MGKAKSLDEHRQDIESIVKSKGGKIIKGRWKRAGTRYYPFFKIECNKGHRWWVNKHSLTPKTYRPEGSWCPICPKGKSLDDHQRDIESIVRAKGGKIIKGEFRRVGQKNPFFKIECDKGHRWWVRKDSLLFRPSNPQGTWCPICLGGKTLEVHQRDIESIVKAKGGKIINKRWGRSGKNRIPSFKIKCNKGHKWWANKSSLTPRKHNPEGSWCPVCHDRISAIGIFGHVPIEYLSLVLLNLKDCKAKHERTLKEGTRPDLIVDRDINFKENIEKHQSVVLFSDSIEEIAVDFTYGLTGKNILTKCFKNYQTKNRFLLIVILREDIISTSRAFQRLINDDVNIDSEDKKRIRVINFEEYLGFLGLGRWNFRKTEEENKIESELRKTISLCVKAIESDSALATLRIKSEKYAQLLGINFANQDFTRLDTFFNQFFVNPKTCFYNNKNELFCVKKKF